MAETSLFLIVFLVVFGIRSAVRVVLNRLNVSHLRTCGGQVPGTFKDLVDQEKMTKISAYAADSARFGLVASLFNDCLILSILLSGFLPWLVSGLTSQVSSSFLGGIVFFALLYLIFNLPQIPFGLYETFVIEERYGFNTQSLRMWFLDLVKQTVLSVALGGAVLCLLLTLLSTLAQTWWIWAWGGLAILEGFIVWLFPVVIAPWFNRFEPITDEAMVSRIRHLMENAGLGVEGVFEMDAGKRTRHTNAYFTGLGRTKRIVLFDTILRSHTRDEILAILSHELGHWKKRHIIKQLVLLEAVSLVGLFVAGQLLDWPLLYRTFGLDGPVAFVGLFLAGILLGLGGFFCRPVVSAISRGLERQADSVASELMGTTVALSQALRKLAVHNLANLNPHPLYAWFYYSHPPVVRRIERFERMEKARQPHEAESLTV